MDASTGFSSMLWFSRTFHEVVEVAVVGAMVFDSIPSLRDGHGLQKNYKYMCHKKEKVTENQSET